MADGDIALLETSAVIDLCFWDEKTASKVKSALEATGANGVVTPYVLFELARSLLHYLILFHAKCRDLDTLSDVIAFAERLFMKKYYQGAVLKALEVFVASADKNFQLNGEQQMSALRAFLRLNIRRGWQSARRMNDEGLNSILCRDLPDPVYTKDGAYSHDLPKSDCGRRDNCGLRPYFALNKSHFEAVRNGLRQLAKRDTETEARIKSLRLLYKVDNRDFIADDCYRCGDAIICHEAIGLKALITKNIRHIGPIGQILGVNVVECR